MAIKSLIRNTSIFVFLQLIVAPLVSAADAQFGLDQRPPTTTCVAPDRPVPNTTAQTVRVFPNLKFSFPELTFFGGSAVTAEQIPGDSTRWFAGIRAGLIISFENSESTSTMDTVLDITDRVEFTAEQSGLAAIAFHPDFASNGHIYVSYSRIGSPLISYVSRFTSVDGGLSFDPDSEEVILIIEQSGTWHVVGQLVFGPDGYLYIGSGDGSVVLTDGGSAQNVNDLRGNILRIDVDSGSPYTIPPGNPFAGGGGAPEIYAWGLRNPWRFNIDAESGEIWAGDVGLHEYEEINKIEIGGNYGWGILEGPSCLTSSCTPENTAGLLDAAYYYNHDNGCAVIGGYVYRGTALPDLVGTYIYGDLCPSTRTVSGLFYDNNNDVYSELIADYPHQLASFAQDNDGELYLLRNDREGFSMMHKLVPASDSGDGTSTLQQKLSETGCVDPNDVSQPGVGMIPYDLNSPLWSDGATKERWMALPDTTQIDITAEGDWDFPVGTVLVKKFSHNGVPHETRLLVHHEQGLWGGYSYEWDADLNDATLLPAGKTKVIDSELTWTYPSRSDCLQCHTNAAGYSLGPESSQLNGTFTYPSSGNTSNQLATLEHIGLFNGGLPLAIAKTPALAQYTGGSAHVTTRARSYLHANCSFCHRPGGTAPVSIDLQFSTAIHDMNVCNVTPQEGDLGITGASIVTPGSSATSVLSARMRALDVHRMPRLGSAVVDILGTGIIDEWINQPDMCDPFPDSDGDGTTDNLDNCTVVPNVNQGDIGGDGYGNICDSDLSNDGFVNSLDAVLLRNAFGSEGSVASDFNGDQIVNWIDIWIFKKYIGRPPGPSGLVD